MLSVFDDGGFPAAPASFNMAAHVLRCAADRGDHPALIVVGARTQTYSYAALHDVVLRTAAGLLDMGLVPGDRILMRVGNTPQFPIVYLAAIAVGLVPVPTSTALTVPEINVIATQVAPKLIIYAEGVALPDQAIDCLEVAALDDFRSLPPAEFHMGDPDRAAYIIYTSGTSGKPRAVVHAHRAIWARKMMWDGWYGLSPDDVMLHAGAFNWTYTLGTGLMDPWSVGATALIPDDTVTADQLPQLLADHRATIFAAAPGIYRRLLRGDVPQLPHLRHGLSAGEKLAETYRDDWVSATGTPIYEAFGMSECSTFISACPSNPAPPGASGFIQSGRRVALMGDDGPVPRGQPGTIAIHRSDPGLMLGYLNEPEKTASRYHGDWFLTGDVAIMDQHGAITYVGRNDDMMNAGGYRVSPIEVEDALTAHPNVSEVAAAAVQLRTGVSVIAAFYVPSGMIDEGELRAFMAARLAGYKTPRIYIAKDNLPRGANNKLLRRTLRHEWETANGQA